MPTIRYVALGDSYTIGTGADPSEAWPNILTKHLNSEGIKIKLAANPATNGFSTKEVIAYELKVFDMSEADFVTLLIGANDWVREMDAATYTKNLKFIIEYVIKKLPDKKNLLLVTIPDFGITPQGRLYGNGRNISKGITEFNNIIKAQAKAYGLVCVDIFEASKQMQFKSELVSEDGLHPSGKGYAEWEKVIFPEAKKLLSK